MASCQVIPEADRLQYVSDLDTSSTRHMLLIDLTGYRCVNCPNAAQEAHNLLELYPGQLIVMELHPSANSFTRSSNPDYNYTSAAGDSLFAVWGGTATNPNLPSGVFNLMGIFQSYQSWAMLTAEFVMHPDTVSPLLLMSVSADPESRTVDISASATSISDQPFSPADLRYSFYLVEDSVIGPQVTNDSTCWHYAHNHLLRQSLQSGSNTIPAKYNWQHCSVVGVLQSADGSDYYDARQIMLNH